MLVEEISDSDLLKYAIENGIIDRSTIQESIEMNERKKFLEQHNNKIWQGKDGKYYTYIPDDKSKRGKRLIKRANEKLLNDAIIECYKAKQDELYVKDVFEMWIKEKLEYGEIQKQSYDKYRNNFIRFFENGTNFSNRKMKFISDDDLEKFIKTNISKMGLSQKAYSDMRILVNGIFKYAKKRGYTTISITQFMGDLQLSKNMFKKTIRKKENEIFLEDEIPMMIEYLREQNDIRSLGLLLLFESGLRVGELSALKISDIKNHVIKQNDVVKNYISVTRTEITLRDENNKCKTIVREYPKSDAGIRNVIITENTMKTIDRIRKINPLGEYLFMENGNRIRGNAFNRKLNRVCKNLSINKRTTHKIRKTYGTTLIDNNVDDALVAEMMGHKDINTTKKYYYYSNKSDKTKVEQMEKALINY